MKPTQAHRVYPTKDQHLQGMVNLLVKDQEAWEWLCHWLVSKDFRVISEWNRQNRLSKPSVHRYGGNRHVHKN
jgi:hypothetical protein